MHWHRYGQSNSHTFHEYIYTHFLIHTQSVCVVIVTEIKLHRYKCDLIVFCFIQCAISNQQRMPFKGMLLYYYVNEIGEPHESDCWSWSVCIGCCCCCKSCRQTPHCLHHSIVCHFHLMMRFVARRLIKYIHTKHTHIQTSYAALSLSHPCVYSHSC